MFMRHTTTRLTIATAGLAIMLGTGLAAPAAAGGVQMASLEATPQADRTQDATVYSFDVYREGSPIGTHTVRVERLPDGRRQARVTIDLKVKLGFIPLYTYRHEAVEVVGPDGRLLSLDAQTDDNGEKLSVTARREGGKVVIDGPQGRKTVDGDVVPTTYWRNAFVEADTLLDTQNGRVLSVTAQPVREDTVGTGEMRRRAMEWKLSGDLDLDIWYTPSGDWAKLAFSIGGDRFEYRPTELPR
mgnify:CR=1 FL=1